MSGAFRRLFAPPAAVIERDSVQVQLEDGEVVEVRRVRDPRARRIKLSVDERGARLTLPARAAAVAGERFLLEHRHWLATQLRRCHAESAGAALVPWQSTHLPLRGQDLPLHWQAGRYADLQLHADGAHFLLPARAGEAALRRTLRAFYEAQARADVGRWLPRYLPGLPRAPRAVRYKIMSSQWGSLAPDGTMALDLALVLARPAAFEYVLVHELCHLLQANHSPAFWAEVEARCPHWREERDWFHEHGRRIKATLRALLQPSG
ncbi:SprT family zinc-dependent metalloprotease [Xanthomonas massiliensis]|uniref:YgjP family zinc-dependent metalloprotease n=1 Tax=Xanthomonas massiliensis TaxID=1720302 RepID=UPI0008256C49|nr:SprT family zinc-dependent metalloprotease [Xanthomonas massiliensis]